MLRIRHDSERIFFLSALTLIAAWFVVVGMYLVTSTATVQIWDDRVVIPANGYLTLQLARGRSVIINRIGDTVYTDSSEFSRRKRLCGVGCSVQLPVSIYYSVLVTENEDDSLTVVKPGFFSFLYEQRL